MEFLVMTSSSMFSRTSPHQQVPFGEDGIHYKALSQRLPSEQQNRDEGNRSQKAIHGRKPQHPVRNKK